MPKKNNNSAYYYYLGATEGYAKAFDRVLKILERSMLSLASNSLKKDKPMTQLESVVYKDFHNTIRKVLAARAKHPVPPGLCFEDKPKKGVTVSEKTHGILLTKRKPTAKAEKHRG